MIRSNQLRQTNYIEGAAERESSRWGWLREGSHSFDREGMGEATTIFVGAQLHFRVHACIDPSVLRKSVSLSSIGSIECREGKTHNAIAPHEHSTHGRQSSHTHTSFQNVNAPVIYRDSASPSLFRTFLTHHSSGSSHPISRYRSALFQAWISTRWPVSTPPRTPSMSLTLL